MDPHASSVHSVTVILHAKHVILMYWQYIKQIIYLWTDLQINPYKYWNRGMNILIILYILLIFQISGIMISLHLCNSLLIYLI